ncbi:hypothetical protein COCVIDRAFT_103559 [Bipolaris victoriae FI3]|uniref:Uncharacterized protein n=1 Tax=Bipolaris victoriae (strain FI3) TaxID=930091 RepID=W7E4S5_BIPV3|nr:hypothetical protein COCVIDRAFT_103559 [Bipolaris victoriae FI3]
MRSTVLLAGALCGLSAANPHPWMYGVPEYPDLDMNEVMTQADVDIMMAVGEISAASDSMVNTQSSTAPSSAASGQEPCAVVGKALAALPSGARPIVPAQLGLQCLQSVPIDQPGNVQLIDDLKLVVKWQSNLAFLKKPPATYTEQPVDIMGQLDNMKTRVATGGFATEYDFQLAMMDLFTSAYDNHFAYQPDILASVMQFQRPPGSELVSISSDGVALPEIYAYRDVLKANNASSFTPSAIKKINGMDTKEYLTNVSSTSDFHDADTRWNALFPSQALLASGTTFLGSFRTGRYQGPNTTFEFANGTVWSQMNVAVVIKNFTGVDSGSAFFQKFCSGPQPPSAAPAPAPPSNNTTPSTPANAPKPSHIGYPKAELINSDLAVGGYFLDGSAYQDVAVLSIPSYQAQSPQAFQNTMRNFIRMSRQLGKTKMIFDLRGNGGGNAILGYDTFKQVYPQAVAEPYGGTRYRANEALNIAGNITSSFLANTTYAQNNRTAFTEALGADATDSDIFALSAPFNYQHTLDIDNKAIPSWLDLFGPVDIKDDKFTPILRYNFSDSVSTSYTGFSVIGYGENANETSTPQPFRAEDMVMLHDGMCSSTCAIVSELLKNQGSVRTIAVGGRPQLGPMQGVGGTKGAQVFAWDDIIVRMQALYALGSPDQQKQWDGMDIGKTAAVEQLLKRSAYNGGQVAGGVNLKDNMRLNDKSGVPLEFIYEAADCRMWFTPRMITDVTQVWKGVADRMFMGNGTSLCIQDSTTNPSSVSGGGQLNGGDGSATAKSSSQFTGKGVMEGEASHMGTQVWFMSLAVATVVMSVLV